MLNAAEEYQVVANQLSYTVNQETEKIRNERLNTSLNKILADVNEAMVEITLEDVGTDVRKIYIELRQAFISYTLCLNVNAQYPNSFSVEELTKDNNTIVSKVEELTNAMKAHLRELES